VIKILESFSYPISALGAGYTYRLRHPVRLHRKAGSEVEYICCGRDAAKGERKPAAKRWQT
jgi:hypothetical protein